MKCQNSFFKENFIKYAPRLFKLPKNTLLKSWKNSSNTTYFGCLIKFNINFIFSEFYHFYIQSDYFALFTETTQKIQTRKGEGSVVGIWESRADWG